jgi:predicted chitinase
MLPIAEYGKGKGRPYGGKIKMNRRPYTTPNKIYYGRGYVQLTWYENYEKMGRLLGVDLLNNPELAMSPPIAIKIMIEGMTKGDSNLGDFTGKSLEMYFNEKANDPKNARRIINGMDKAALIAGYHYKFLKALS